MTMIRRRRVVGGFAVGTLGPTYTFAQRLGPRPAGPILATGQRRSQTNTSRRRG